MKRHWPCFLLLALTAIDLLVPDPLPFIDEAAKRNILGHNAAKLFGLDTLGK